jgi:hypothetical protein
MIEKLNKREKRAVKKKEEVFFLLKPARLPREQAMSHMPTPRTKESSFLAIENVNSLKSVN